MNNSTDNLSFRQDLRRALYHLYDPAQLRQNPLVELLQAAQSGDPSSSLRRILLEAIEALKPDASVPAQSNAWRVYRLLSQRFAEQFSQRDVATDLVLSIRQLRRHESLALGVLADYLWTHHDLASIPPAANASAQPGKGGSATGAGTPSREEELEWLKKSVPSEAADVSQVVSSLLEVIAPLAKASGVEVISAMPKDLPRISVRLTAMRQTLLSLLTAAIKRVPGGRVAIRAGQVGHEVCVLVEPVGKIAHLPRTSSLGERETLTAEDLAIARQLVSLAGGSLEIDATDGKNRRPAIKLHFAATEQVQVLVIDDNVDTLQLLERYLAATRYHFAAATDPQRAVALADELAPQVIVLDVMLPAIDGWELLGRLRAHPRTHAIPIIVCTILQQEDLALALGAAGFIRKPVDRAAFLSALDHVVP